MTKGYLLPCLIAAAAMPGFAAAQSAPSELRVRGDERLWLTRDDVPDTIDLNQTRAIDYEIDITTAAPGRASNCRITRSSGNAELDRIACAVLMRRSRFVPTAGEGDQQHIVTGTYHGRFAPRAHGPVPTIGKYDTGKLFAGARAPVIAVPAGYVLLGEESAPGWGYISYSVNVSASGEISGCKIDTAGPLEEQVLAERNRQACQIIRQRQKFQPAIDGDGNPIAGMFPEGSRGVRASLACASDQYHLKTENC